MSEVLTKLLPILLQVASSGIDWNTVAKEASDIIDKVRASGKTDFTLEDLKPILDEFKIDDDALSAAIAQARAEGR